MPGGLCSISTAAPAAACRQCLQQAAQVPGFLTILNCLMVPGFVDAEGRNLAEGVWAA
jgi:hypothetical protein